MVPTSTSSPTSPPIRIDRPKLVSTALCSAMVDLVFQPPAPPSQPFSASSEAGDPALAQHGSRVAMPIPERFLRDMPHPCEHGFPETLYLDHARLTSYITDSADLLGLYMLIMLFRQLTTTGTSGAASVALEDWEIDRIKREVWEVGPSRLGLCFDVGPQLSSSGTDPKVRWEKGMGDVSLQIAKRAEEARERMSRARTLPTGEASVSEASADTPAATDRVPSPWVLSLIEKWKATHYRKDSPLQKMLQQRLQAAVLDVVKDAVAASTGADASSGKSPSARAYSALPMRKINRHPLTSSPSSPNAMNVLKKNPGSGLEPLMPEILHLGDRIARLVLFHSRVYKRLYEVDGFIDPAL